MCVDLFVCFQTDKCVQVLLLTHFRWRGSSRSDIRCALKSFLSSLFFWFSFGGKIYLHKVSYTFYVSSSVRAVSRLSRTNICIETCVVNQWANDARHVLMTTLILLWQPKFSILTWVLSVSFTWLSCGVDNGLRKPFFCSLLSPSIQLMSQPSVQVLF